MTRIPLYYCDELAGYARVSDDLPAIDAAIVWRLRVPTAVRKLVGGSKSLIATMLYDDTAALRRCTPFAWYMRGLPIYLARVALRPELIPLVNGPRSPLVTGTIVHIHKSVGIISHRDGDRTNCTFTNLQEFEPQGGWDDPYLTVAEPQEVNDNERSQ